MTRQYHYSICDVFTEQRFGGNPLAVIADASGLSDSEMQQIAREFNFSESTFVLPPEHGGDKRVRIFTPSREVPFAGHPNVGTAFVLSQSPELATIADERPLRFEELAGEVPVRKFARGGRDYFELTAPEPFNLGAEVDLGLVAKALGLSTSDIATNNHVPRLASVGLAFVMVELKELTTLAKVKLNQSAFDELADTGIMPDLHCYVRLDENRLQTRMFAPLDGVPEDPATGSANGALGGLLAHLQPEAEGDWQWQMAQGVEMGRPSQLQVSAAKHAAQVTWVKVAGTAVIVATGQLQLD